MRRKYCKFLKDLLKKQYNSDDISILLDSFEEFEDELNDRYGEDKAFDVVSDLLVHREDIEEYQQQILNKELTIDDFNQILKDTLSAEIEYFA